MRLISRFRIIVSRSKLFFHTLLSTKYTKTFEIDISKMSLMVMAVNKVIYNLKIQKKDSLSF